MTIKHNKAHAELLLASSVDFLNYEVTDGLIDLLVETTSSSGIEELVNWAKSNGSFLCNSHCFAYSKFSTLKIKIAQLENFLTQDFVVGAELSSILKKPSELASLVDLETEKTIVDKSSLVTSASLQETNQEKTLVACIDNGCPFAHAEFMTDRGQTRAVTIWDQDQTSPAFWSLANATPPMGMGYGLHVLQADLQKIINSSISVDGSVDENLCYTSCSYEPLRADLTHGSHVLGLLAGKSYGLKQVNDLAAQSDIAFVQLPKSFLAMPSSGAAHRYILDGLRFLRDFATANQYSRCVVVCDYGSYLGPHDGSSIFERALSAFVNEQGVEFDIVFPSGNNAGQSTHLAINTGTVDEVQLDWLLAANSFGPSFAEFWLHAVDADAIECITVAKPAEGMALRLDKKDVTSSSDKRITLAWADTDTEQQYIALVAGPTHMNQNAIEPGKVSITIKFKKALFASVDAYLSWGGKNIGQPAYLKQAAWSIPSAYESMVSIADQGTLLGSACVVSDRVHIAGGYVGHADLKYYSRANYSSIGPTRGARPGPDCLACTDERHSLRGIPGPGTRSPIVRRLWGTSMAAPQLARQLVNQTYSPAAPTRGEAKYEVGSGYLNY
jgi:hypothetical protein